MDELKRQIEELQETNKTLIVEFEEQTAKLNFYEDMLKEN